MRMQLGRLIPVVAAAVALAMLAVSCGAAEEPTPTPTLAPRVVPTPTPTLAPGVPTPTPTTAPVKPTPSPTPGLGTGGGGIVVATPTPVVGAPTPTPAPQVAIKRGGIVRTAHRRSPLYFRLDLATTIDNVANVTPLFNGLVAMQSPNFVAIGPDLAESWDISADGKTYTFHIVPGVVNHKGHPWTARDGKWYLETLASTTANRPPHEYVSVAGESIFESIEAPNDTTLIVKLKEADGLFLANMATVYAPMYTRADYDEMGSLTTPVGTGPYYLAKTIPGELIQYRKFEQYFKKGLPYVDGVDMFVIRDTTPRLAALEAKKIDMIQMGSSHGVFLDAMAAIAKRHPGEMTYYEGIHAVGRAVQYQFRRDGPWQDKRVRQAINLAITRDDVCTGIPGCYIGDWAPSGAYGITDLNELRKKPGYAAPGPAKDAEIAQAKRLMAEAGYANGFEVKVLCRDAVDYRDLFCPVMEFILRKTLNIRSTLDVQETGTWNKTTEEGTWDMDFGSWGGMRVDHPYDWLDSDAFCGQEPIRNKGGWCNKEYDDILREMRVLSDPARLQVLFNRAIAILDEEQPVAVGFWPVRSVIVWNYVKNMPDEHFSGQYSQARRLEQVWLDR